jgi:chaperone required for assembly of F1-ATPase
MKRFYKKASVEQKDQHFIVLLDGKAIKTPAQSFCHMPTRKMAKAVVKEWNDQGEEVIPNSMPITKLMNTAIDRVENRREELIDELVRYAGSDQICYRAEHPTELVSLQDKIWNPLLQWVNETLAIDLKISRGVIFVEQDKESLKKIKEVLERLDSFALTALHGMITVTGSVSIGYALYCDHLSIEQAWNAGHLDENFQVSQWGNDAEAEERRKNLRLELTNSYDFLQLSMPD